MITNKFSMSKLMQVREEIYNQLHEGDFYNGCFSDDAEYAQCYTCMYLIADTAENIATHRDKGFTYNKTTFNLDYLELVGLLQLIYIQQDSIADLYALFMGSKLNVKDHDAWGKIRKLRNVLIGHPSRSSREKNVGEQFSFIGRTPISYKYFTYENYQVNKRDEAEPFSGISHPIINLGCMIDSYEADAVSILDAIKCEVLKRKKRS
ncbi:hypothetical protein I5Q23_22760 [Serratia marcescens]|nr:hypothetical protein [Serratia marcescens]